MEDVFTYLRQRWVSWDKNEKTDALRSVLWDTPRRKVRAVSSVRSIRLHRVCIYKYKEKDR